MVNPTNAYENVTAGLMVKSVGRLVIIMLNYQKSIEAETQLAS
jgi:hypothetical protein